MSKTLPTITKDRTLAFNGTEDSRYTFPFFSQTARFQKVYFNGTTIATARGTLEVLALAAEHNAAL